jgi:hypothetical protein
MGKLKLKLLNLDQIYNSRSGCMCAKILGDIPDFVKLGVRQIRFSGKSVFLSSFAGHAVLNKDPMVWLDGARLIKSLAKL